MHQEDPGNQLLPGINKTQSLFEERALPSLPALKDLGPNLH